MKKWSRCITGVVMLVILCGNFVSAAEKDFPDSDQKGKITVHSFNVDDFENLKGSTGEKVDETNLPDHAKKEANIEYTLQRLDDSSGKAVSVNSPIDQSFGKQEGKTNENGELVFANLPKGYYLISEGASDDYLSQKSPFVVMLPMKTNRSDGSQEWNYDVHVYPKHAQRSGISKKTDKENIIAGYGDEIVWHINYEVGADIKEETENGTVYAKNFYITDTMDSRLNYVESSAVFRLYDRSQTETGIEFQKNVHYTETYNKETHTVRWDFTDAGIKVLADNYIGMARVSIRTIVNESALGTTSVIWNNASVDFLNFSGDPYHLEVFADASDKNGENVPKAYLGSITVDVYEKGQEEIKLARAVFKLAKTEQEAKEGKFIQLNGADYEITTQEAKDSRFIQLGNSADYEMTTLEAKGGTFIQLENGADYEATTDQYGQAIFTALGSGEYWLVETKSTEGYQLLKSPVKVTIGENPEEANVLVSIEKERETGVQPNEPDEPNEDGKTSSPGFAGAKTGDVITFLGLIILLIIAILTIYFSRRKRREESHAEK